MYGNAISAARSLQKCITLSSTEAEYVVLAEAAKETIWLRNVLNKLGVEQGTSTIFKEKRDCLE